MNKLEKYDDLRQNANLSFQRLIDMNIENKDLSRSLLNGTIIENSSFQNVSFKDADIEGTRIINSKMNYCSMKTTDIRSLWAVDTNFTVINFDDSSIIDCTFIGCTFNKCSFNGLTMLNCEFSNCNFNPFNLENSSSMLNTYKASKFENTMFKNVFYYGIFEECSFVNTTIDAYLLGYLFGLKPQELEQLNYIFMGKPTNHTIKNIYDELMEIYMERGMFINAGILQMIDPDFSKDSALINCIDFLEEYIKRDFLVKTEQIQFLSMILQKLYENEQVMPITTIIIHRKLLEITESYKTTSLEKALREINILKNLIYSMYLQYIDKLLPALHSLPLDEKVVLKITYDKKPQIELVKILEQIDCKKEPPILIKTKTGSFIEWIQCTGNTIECLNILISLLGIVVPILSQKVKDKKSVIKQNSRQTDTNITINNYFKHEDLALMGQFILPKQVRELTQDNREVMAKTIKIIINNNIISDKHYYGYNSHNVKKVKVFKR